MEALDKFPNYAAFHAQQCAEKSLKAALVELSPVSTEKELKEKVWHNTIMAILGVLGQTVKDVAQKSGYGELEGTLRKSMEQKKPGAGLAWVIYYAFSSAYTDFFTLFQTPPIQMTSETWVQSLDPRLVPNPSLDPTWRQKRSAIEETLKVAWDIMWSAMGIQSGVPFDKLVSNPTDAKFDFVKMARELESKGQGDAATSVIGTTGLIDRLSKVVLDWVAIVVSWAPYLDSHAVTPRYATQEQLAYHESHNEGVKNLLGRAQEIMEQTPRVIESFASVR